MNVPAIVAGPTVEFTIPEEPVSKSRHKTGVRGGQVYHYKDTKTANAQQRVGGHYRQARGPGAPGEGGFGVEMRFYLKSRQRRDVDNFVKLILDGLTGYAWVDDSQVTEISAKVIHGADAAHSEVTVYATDDLPDRLRRACVNCGEGFQLPPSWVTTKKYCSTECSAEARRLRIERTCDNCGKKFKARHKGVPRPFCSVECNRAYGQVLVECAHCHREFTKGRAQNKSGRSYCDEKCMADYRRAHPSKYVKGTCVDCGGSTSKKSYQRCAACQIVTRVMHHGHGSPPLLSTEDARFIRQRIASGETKAAMARHFKCSAPCVTGALRRLEDSEAVA